jgi:hypothetical protein
LTEVGCSNKQKFLVRPATGVRKQLLFINKKPTLAFVNKGKKFTACAAFLDITPKVFTSHLIVLFQPHPGPKFLPDFWQPGNSGNEG